MLWVFIIVGLLTSASAVCRVGLALGARRRSWPLEALILVPLAVAWGARHTTGLGWIAMLVAFGIELLCWVATEPPPRPTKGKQPDGPAAGTPPEPRSESTASARPASQTGPAPPTQPAPTAAPSTDNRPDLEDAASPQLAYTTVALLGAVREVVPEVFHASLRRVGQRDAALLIASEAGPTGDAPGSRADRFAIRAGQLILEVYVTPSPVPPAEIEYAAGQTWDWPQAAQALAGHVAQITLTSRSPVRTARAEIVRLHHRAHAALAEFAPIVAVLWRGAGRVAPADGLAELARQVADALPDAAAALACCVSFRICPLAEEGAERYVSDTVGLHAFALPDLQIVTHGRPDEPVSAALYELALGVFTGGANLREGEVWSSARGEEWRAGYREASCPPVRNVMQLTGPPRTPPSPDLLPTGRGG